MATVVVMILPARAKVQASGIVTDGNATISTVSENAWYLENSALTADVSFANGSIDMTSFYNKAAHMEYLTGSGPRELFNYVLSDGSAASAMDGNWTLTDSQFSDINLYGRTWGEQLEITLTCTQPVSMQVKLVFQLYNGDAGIRYQCYVKNNTTGNLTIKSSDVLQLNFPNKPHTAYYVPNMIWASTGGSLYDARNCVMAYNSGDGWCMAPELNWQTNTVVDSTVNPSTASGQPPFGGIYAWVNGEQSVRFSTNPASLQLVLFPGEEMPYLAVNLTVFKGGEMDGRASVEDHFEQRYKYWNPTTTLSLNDWEWYSSGNRTDDYYRNTVVPTALAGGFDRLDVDDKWNLTTDSTEPLDVPVTGKRPLPAFTTDLASLSQFVTDHGLQIGYWFSPCGYYPSVKGTFGALTVTMPAAPATYGDLADWNQVQTKIGQMENVLIGQYHASWTQIDKLQLYQNTTQTTYSSPSDSVYRKAVNLEKYENYFTDKYPNFGMRITNQLDLGGSLSNRNCGLIDLADNGMLSAKGEFNDGDINICFNSFGYFPMNSNFLYYASSEWYDTTEWMYEFLSTRESMLYRSPTPLPNNSSDFMDARTLALLKTFNTWRKNPRIEAILDDSFRPVTMDNTYSWMYTNADKSQGIVIATDANHSKTPGFTAKLDWLDPGKTYLVQDMTLNDNGTFSNSLVTRATGAELKSKGFYVDYKTNTSNGKAYWIQEDDGQNLQVAYADSNVNAYTQSLSNNTLTVNITAGTANSTAKIAVYDRSMPKEQIKSCTLDSNGTGTLTFTMSNS